MMATESFDKAHALAWVEKYRPQTLSGIMGHEYVLKTLRAFLNRGDLPHILFYGPPGTGKTSTVKALLNETYGSAVGFHVLELNASDSRGIDVVRYQLKEFASTSVCLFKMKQEDSDLKKDEVKRENNKTNKVTTNVSKPSTQTSLSSFFKAKDENPTALAQKEVVDMDTEKPSPMSQENAVPPKVQGQQTLATKHQFSSKVIVLDEVDQMTTSAQMALRRIMEQYVGTTRFFLLCNELSKIHPAIQSRCVRFRLGRLPNHLVEKRLNDLLESENVKLTEDGKQLLIHSSEGDFRRIFNGLQMAAMMFKHRKKDEPLNEMDLSECLGFPSEKFLTEMLRILMTQSMADAFQYVRKSIEVNQFMFQDVVKGLHKLCMSKLDLPTTADIVLTRRLAEMKQRADAGADLIVQMACMVAAFVEVNFELKRLCVTVSIPH